MKTIYREITPLTQNDFFSIFSRVKKEFSFPLHYHNEYELNFVANAAGTKRVVGDHTEVINDYDLVLVGSNLPHGWFTHECSSNEIFEITIQFHPDIFDDKLLRRNELTFIKNLFDKTSKGIAFPKETAISFKPRLEKLTKMSGFDSILEFISILHDLSTSRSMRTLSNNSVVLNKSTYSSRKMEKAYEYIQANYNMKISLSDVAKILHMSEVSCSRFIKQHTGKTFIDSLNEVRLGHASRLLIDTTHTISEISYKCGFNNLSLFNRVFKKKKGCTPKEFRHNYSGLRVII